jgi:hypothetical protein
VTIKIINLKMSNNIPVERVENVENVENVGPEYAFITPNEAISIYDQAMKDWMRTFLLKIKNDIITASQQTKRELIITASYELPYARLKIVKQELEKFGYKPELNNYIHSLIITW